MEGLELLLNSLFSFFFSNDNTDFCGVIFRRPLSSVSTASKEISDTSSIGDFSGDEYSEDEKYEHRPTLTEPSSIPSSDTNL